MHVPNNYLFLSPSANFINMYSYIVHSLQRDTIHARRRETAKLSNATHLNGIGISESFLKLCEAHKPNKDRAASM